ncbi:restriction endonuclease, SacI family [Kitasatospora sp. NPDC052868]|uniref:restriction endonuclease, SacI family n=1 Tax=Kitasatospora sp. NPDC052868 TaxID=3364060 RepID=UPI0037CA7F79
MVQGGGQKITLRVAKEPARRRFLEALTLATSDDEELPAEWIDRSRQVGRAQNATNTPMLGTALLAKATNKEVTALALQTNVHRGYSARGVAKNILVPLCVEHEIDLRTTGAEPLNNQPFFAKQMVVKTLIPESRPVARAELEHLIECLQAADYLDEENAVRALAAFLRVRIEDGNQATVLQLDKNSLTLPDLCKIAAEFINVNREGGRRGQALVAACLDLVHPGMVYADSINDPSRNIPGDVSVKIPKVDHKATQDGLFEASELVDPTDFTVILSAEAKQKPVSQSEVLQFVERLAVAGIGKGIYAAIEPNQDYLEPDKLAEMAQKRNGVLLGVVSDPAELIKTAMQWSPIPLADCLANFPQLLVQRLKDFHCGADSQQEWAQILNGATSDHK